MRTVVPILPYFNGGSMNTDQSDEFARLYLLLIDRTIIDLILASTQETACNLIPDPAFLEIAR